MEAKAKLRSKEHRRQERGWGSFRTQIGAKGSRILEVRLQGKAERAGSKADGAATGRQEAGRQTALAAAEDFRGEFAELEVLILANYGGRKHAHDHCEYDSRQQ